MATSRRLAMCVGPTSARRQARRQALDRRRLADEVALDEVAPEQPEPLQLIG